MEDTEALAILRQGVAAWNLWRSDNPHITPNLAGAMLMGINSTSKQPLQKGDQTDLSGINLSGAYLHDARLEFGILDHSDLSGANLSGINLERSSLRGARLNDATLVGANLRGANLSKADLSNANLMRATLVETHFEGAILRNCNIYGVSVWGITLDEHTDQSNLVIANYNEATMRVPSLEIAQLVYLLLDHQKLRDVIQTVGEHGVLILGRFTPERKAVLDAIADRLIELHYLPTMFDFKQIPGRNFTETITTLAGMSKFVIADITQPRSVQQEAQAIIPIMQIPFVAIIEAGEQPWSMFKDMTTFPWVFREVMAYRTQHGLLDALPQIVAEAEKKYAELKRAKSEAGPIIRQLD